MAERGRGFLLPLLLVLAGCGGTEDGAPGGAPSPASGCEGGTTEQPFPDVLDATISREGDTYRIAVTLSSPYDSPERYADGWRIMDTEGRTLAEHTLLHDHATEQPFTRAQSGVTIPDGVGELIVEGRDLCNGYGGTTLTIAVRGSGETG